MTQHAELTGRIVRADDADQPGRERRVEPTVPHDPMAVGFAQQTGDVLNAQAWARQNNVTVRVRSGRHCLEGWSNVDDGIAIDVSEMKSVTLDAASGTATVGAGLNQLEAVTALGMAGFAAPAAPTGGEGTSA